MDSGIVSIEKAILCDICLGVPLGRIWSPRSEAAAGKGADAPGTFLFHGEQLGLLKSLYASGQREAVDAVRALTEAADRVLATPLYTVVDKPQPAPGGDPHDYQSFGKYWWPNPATDDGLPYVRRDGEVNPECYGDSSDYPRLVHFSETVVLLALAAYLSGEERYAGRAMEHLRTWFLNQETLQNPNFRFAQTVPGSDGERWEAVIEARHLLYVTEAVRLLEHVDALSKQESRAVRDWYGELLHWMRESAQGRQADEADNNIALWYDLQCMVYAKFCGDDQLVSDIVRKSSVPRLEQQIAPDGSLPHEISRARSYDYVAFSVAAMALLSRAAESADIRLWDIEEGDGRNYQAAHDWLLNMTASDRLVAPVARLLGQETAAGAGADHLQQLLDLGLLARGMFRMAKEREVLLEQADKEVFEVSETASAMRAELAKANERLREAEVRSDALKAEIAALRGKTAEAVDILVRQQARLEAYTGEIESRYLKILRSWTWRLMGPLREMIRVAKRIARGRRIPRSTLPKRPVLELGPAERILSEVTGRKVRLTDPRHTAHSAKETGNNAALPRPSLYIRPEDAHDVPAAEAAEARPDGIAAGADAAFEICRQLEGGDRSMDERALRLDYEASGLSRVPDTFVLYRIIGNDLYPRHALGQSRENVRFLLDNEPALEGCEKRWIVNRIVDPAEERSIIELLESRGQPYVRIPFDYEEYRRIGWDTSVLPYPDFLGSDEFAGLGPKQTNRLIAALYRLKNNYAMNNNGARNAALRDGRERAKWILPWDGNCFVTAKAWKAIRAGVAGRPFLKYFVVPMQRITDNSALLRDDFTPCPVEEPQVIFRCDAGESFNESFCYGRRPKIELFWRLAIPGKWDAWDDDPWDQQRRSLSGEAFQYGAAGWVARMFSGVVSLERESRESFKNRGRVRQSAIISTIDYLDERLARSGSDRLGLTCYSMDMLESARRALRDGGDESLADQAKSIVRDAEEALSRGPYSVTDKSTVAPSGDIHDYWHPAPYWWPNPDTADGLPYVKRDGERVPGTHMYEPESERYDRTRVQRLFDDTTALSLAWFLTGRREFAEHAARNVERWFVSPETRMNPHLRFSQVRMGHNGNQGYSSGIIELKDFYYFLDAVRILETTGALATESRESFRRWLQEYLAWLTTSDQGRKEQAATNNHGTYYDLQTAAISAYLGDGEQVLGALQRARARIPSQFASDGSQPEELKRSATAHYCCFNLQGWLNLSLLGARYGVDLWSEGVNGAAGLARGASWLLDLAGKPWPYEQILPFDSERFDPLSICAAFWGGGRDPGAALELRRRARSRFDPHDGVPPYWNIAWPSSRRRPDVRAAVSPASAGGVIAFPHRGARSVVKPSGATISMLLLARKLQEMGIRTVVLVHKDGLSQEKWTGAFRETAGPWKQLADEYGLPCYTVDSPVLGKGESISYLQASAVRASAKHWKEAVESLGIVAVHTNDASMHWTWGEISTKLGLPHIWHERGLFRHRRSGKFLARANPIIVISDYVRSLAPASLKERVHIVRNPVDAPLDLDREQCRAELRREFGLPDDAVIFGMVANDNPRKRWDIFVDAAVEMIRLSLSKQGAKPVYFMAVGGGGVVVDEIRSSMNLDPMISEHILCIGYRSPVYPTIYGLDCIVATADREPLGRVLIEAAQLGIPLFASRSGGHIDVLEESASEFLVDLERGARNLISACVRFLSDPDYYNRIAARVQADMRTTYSVDTHALSILSIYRDTGIRVFGSGSTDESAASMIGAPVEKLCEATSASDNEFMISAIGTRLYVDSRDRRVEKMRKRDGGGGQRVVRNIWDYMVASDYARIFLDIGANYGEIGLGTRYPPDSRVYLFEANPRLEPYLAKSRSEHPDASDIRLCSFALGVKDEELVFGISKESSGASSLIFDKKAVQNGRIEPVTVRCHRLDSCLGDLSGNYKTAVLKIDVEGAELDVLRGGEAFLDRLEGYAAIVELNPRAMTLARGAISVFLEELSGYGTLLELSGNRFEVFDPLRFQSRRVNKDIVVARGEALKLLEAYPQIVPEGNRRVASQTVLSTTLT